MGPTAGSRGSRVAGATVLTACAAALPVLLVRDGESLYPPATWVLLGVLGIAGLSLVADFASVLTDRRQEVAAAAGLVVGAQLAGTGAWAVKHWEPFFGTRGGSQRLPELRALAALLVLCGLVAAACCLRVLVLGRVRSPRAAASTSRSALAVGVAVTAGLPWVLARGEARFTDVTSLGALALVFSIPWGGALVLAGWLPYGPSLALTGSVAVLATVALVGPGIGDIGPSHPVGGFLLAVVAATGLAIRLGRAGSLPGGSRARSAAS